MAGYLTIAGPAQAQINEKRSQFIAKAFPVTSQEEAKAIIKRVSNEYHDARHACYAYVVGAGRDIYNSSDNGEPSGTAGKPILGQINSFSLTNVLIVVVRYFGGVKLGTPGLIAAYREAARQAIESSKIVECQEMTEITVVFDWERMDAVMKQLKALKIKPAEQTLDNLCRFKLVIPVEIKDELTSQLKDISIIEH